MRPELQDIVDEAAKVLGADTTLEDREFNLVAYGTQQFDIDTVRTTSILQRRSSRPIRDWFEQFGITGSDAPLRTPADPASGVRSRLCFPVRWRGVTYGYLWALDDATELDDPAVTRVGQLAEHAAAYLAPLSRQHQEDGFLVADLISSDADKARQAAGRLRDGGRLGRRTAVVAVVVSPGTSDLPQAPAPNLWSLPRSVLAHHATDVTTLIVPLLDPEDDRPAAEAAALTRTLYELELPGGLATQPVAGIGDPQTDLDQARASWLHARLAARVAAAVPEQPRVLRWSELGLYRLLASLPPGELTALVLDTPVRRLLDAGDPDLLTTVRVYLDKAGSAQETAAALHIHRQTLYYRLNKAESLSGLSLADGQDRARLHLGLMLASLG